MRGGCGNYRLRCYQASKHKNTAAEVGQLKRESSSEHPSRPAIAPTRLPLCDADLPGKSRDMVILGLGLLRRPPIPTQCVPDAQDSADDKVGGLFRVAMIRDRWGCTRCSVTFLQQASACCFNALETYSQEELFLWPILRSS